MKSSFRTALIAAIVSAVIASGAAVATTQTFTLGQTNRVDAPSKVTNLQSDGTTINSVDAPVLTLQNASATANATPLSLLAASGRPPFKVNTQTKVANLNADQLDGRDSTGFYLAGSKVADSLKADNATTATTAFGLKCTGCIFPANLSGSLVKRVSWQGGSGDSTSLVIGLTELDIACLPDQLRINLVSRAPAGVSGEAMGVFQRSSPGPTGLLWFGTDAATGPTTFITERSTYAYGSGNLLFDLPSETTSTNFFYVRQADFNRCRFVAVSTRTA
jgi:hypothetical protein